MLHHAVFACCALASLLMFARANWAYHIFQAAIFIVAILWSARNLLGRRSVEMPLLAIPLLALPAWGLAQLALGLTAYPAGTVIATVHWLSLVVTFLLAAQFCREHDEREKFLNDFAGFGAAMAVLCVLQLFTSHGKVLWVIPTDFDDYVYATFPYYNNYAQFIELALPIALWRAIHARSHGLAWGIAAAVMYGSVIASTSRAGSILCTAEIGAVLAITAFRRLGDWRVAAARVVVLPLLLSTMILIVGWERLMVRFEQDDPFAFRREMALAGLEMIKTRPLTGFGLGTFTSVYPAYAIYDDGTRVNAAHNDWIEYTADGGFLFALCLFGPILWLWPAAARSGWGIGLIAVMVHAFVDYPLLRPGTAAWLFTLLAAVDGRRLGSAYRTNPARGLSTQ